VYKTQDKPVTDILLTTLYTLLLHCRKEADSIETGAYKLPYDMNPTSAVGMAQYNPTLLVRQFAAFHKAAREAAGKASSATSSSQKAQFVAPGRYPKYFLQHGGDALLSTEGVARMDYEMDSRVWGMGDAMRRRALAKVSIAIS
jgi:hypothetical protein